jgi:hypothetical protein
MKGIPVSRRLLARIVCITAILSVCALRGDDVPDRTRRRYPELARVLESAILIPGLNDGLIPQGIAVLAEPAVAVLTYDHPDDGRAAVCAFVDLATGRLLQSFPLHNGREPFTGHAGGVAVCQGSLWIASEGALWRFPLPAADRPSGSLDVLESYPVDSEASFVSCDGATLWVGDFTRPGSHPTPEHHQHGGCRGWLAAYRLGNDGRPLADQQYNVDGREVLRPDEVLFVGDEVQGCAVSDELIAISRSYGPADSRLEYYDRSTLGASFAVALPDGRTAPGRELGERAIAWSTALPAGAEDIEWRDDSGRLLITFEGGAIRYRDRWKLFGAFVEDRFYVLHPLPPAANTDVSYEAELDATHCGWMPVGIRARAGQTIRIQATGHITLQRNDLSRYPYTDADGLSRQLREFAGIEAPNGSLLVRIGNAVYRAGTDVTVTADRGGLVSLAIVENGDCTNNDGTLSIKLSPADQ